MPILSKCTIGDVKKVFACDKSNEDYVGVFRLGDKRFVCVRGEYCEEEKVVYRSEAQASCSLDEIIRFGLTERERRKLNLLLPDDPGF